MTENTKIIPFNAWIDFNNPIFIELDSYIRPLFDKKETDLSRELQIRALLYTNFNNYLTLLLSKTNEDKALEVLEGLDKVPEANRLGLIISIINKPIEEITNNFIKLFSSKD